MNIDYISTIVSISSALFTLLGVYFAVWIYRKSNRTTLLLKVYDLIQSESCVNNRKCLFENLYDNIKYHNYVDKEIDEKNFIEDLKFSQEKLDNLKTSKDKRLIDNWEESDIKYAEEVCRSFDLAGIILKGDSKGMNTFVNIWREVIEKSFTACKPLIDYRRKKQRNPLFWHMFEEMDKKARKF